MSYINDLNLTKKTMKKVGFTIVELLVVIVIIAIIAAIAIIAYNGIQKRTIASVLQSDLRNGANFMRMANVEVGSYPTTLPVGVKPSRGVVLTLATGGGSGTYVGLSAAQNGLLFFDTCQRLLAEGVGKKLDDNHDYVSACTVSSKNQVHINGWNGRDVNTPITDASLQAYVSSYSGGQKDLFTTKGGNFMYQLSSQFTAAGGSFPVAVFWDSWATPVNGGMVKPDLPAPTGGGATSDPNSFCLNAVYEKSPTLKWYVRQDGVPTEGNC